VQQSAEVVKEEPAINPDFLLKVIECSPAPYMILQGLANSERIVQVIEQEGVTLTVTAYAC